MEGEVSATLPEKPRPIMVVLGPSSLEAAKVAAGEVYDIHDLAAIGPFERFPGRDVVLWFCHSGHSAFAALGDRLTNDDFASNSRRLVKFLAPAAQGVKFGPVEGIKDLGWAGWEDFLLWAKDRVQIFTPEAFSAAVALFYGMDMPEGGAQDALVPDVPDEAAEEALASLEDGPIPEPPDGSLDEPAETSTVFHVEPGEPWPIPMDLWEGSTLPDVRAEWLPVGIADYVLDQAQLIGADPAQMAVNCVTVAAACIREDIALQMMADNERWTERARLWGAVVGDPSTKKGPAFDAATRHFMHLAHERRARQESELAAYADAQKIHDGQMQDYYREAKKNASAQRPPTPEAPASQRLWTDDATKESLARILSNHSRGKITILKDELAAWFGGFDAYGNGKSDKDRPDYLSLYEGRERYIDRVGEGRSIHVPRWSACILGAIQPSVIAKVAAKLGDDGMLARFQVVTAGPAREGEERRPDAAATARWQRVVGNLLDLDPLAQPVRLSAAAQAHRAECGRWINKTMGAGLNPPVVAALGKWEGLYGRLAITFHCVDAADKGRQTPEHEIPLATVQRVWAYMHQFLWPHAIKFYDETQTEPEWTSWQRWVAGLILAQRLPQITTTILMRGWKGYRKLKDPQRRELLGSLVAVGWLAPAGGMDRGGKMPSRYDVNPQVHAHFTQARDKYIAQRARMTEAMQSNSREAGQD